MKRKLIWLAVWALLPTVIFAQADLVVTAAGFAPEQIDKGDIFTIQVFVENTGNAESAANYMFIYYTDDLEIADEEIVSRVSIKPLEAGESQEIFFAYPIAPSLPAGDYYIGFEVDPFNDVAELDEENLFCASQGGGCATFNITNEEVAYQKFTYPMIFIHGWTGNDETWDEFHFEAESYYGWSFGGRLDYCLNPDGNQSTSDGFILDLVNDEFIRPNGDFYRVNFDISADEVLYVGNDGIGFNDDFSNQSAIVKQGWAVSNAVERVLELTGAEKVILVGHSMGGLAAREYLQNSDNWQSDGEHHVAKLLTVGTPNGGSNLSGGNLGGILNGLDEFSEAVRDLRWKNFLFDGDYLDGGLEDNFSVYYNDDIDCNGFVGDLITGLNEKASPSDLDYACVVGVGNNPPSFSGDGVVAEARADLNNYLLAPPPLASLHADRFDVSTSHLDIHKENHATLIRGLDEPDVYETAYPVPLNSFNLGFSTEQAPNHPLPGDVDWDDYRIEVSTSGTLTVNVLNIPVHQFAIFLLDENFNILEQVDPTGESNLFYSVDIDPGIYYVEAASIPTPNSWRFPYAYDVFFEPSEPLVASFNANQQEGCVPFTVNFAETSTGGAESFAWSFEGGTPASSTSPNPVVTYNEPGVYPVTLTVSTNTAEASTSENAYITVDATPEAAFTFEVQQDRTVDFSNQTIFALEQPSYNWDFGDGQNSSLPAPSHTYTNDGVYQVELQASNNCGATTSEQSVEIVTVSNEIEEVSLGIKGFPIPTKDIVNIEIDGAVTGLCQLELINQLGQEVHSVTVYKSSSNLNIPFNLHSFPSGIYVVRLSLKDFVSEIQVIKE